MKLRKTKPVPSPPATNIICRWLIHRDMPEVLEIERRSFEIPWTEEEFLIRLRERNTIGTIAESSHMGPVYGFMVYELHSGMLLLKNLAVAPEVRRTGVATELVSRLIAKLSSQRRTQIQTNVSERNIDAQMFFAALGFKATEFVRDHFEDGEGLIEFRYTVAGVSCPEFRGVNRITEYE